jgi:hypothetical protein
MSSGDNYAVQEHVAAMRMLNKPQRQSDKHSEIQMIEHADPMDYGLEDDGSFLDYDEHDNASSLDLAYHASTVSTDTKTLSEAIDAAKDQLDIPGLADAEPRKQDALTVHYLSEASRKLGKTNSAYFYQQQALTIVEIIQLKAKKLQRSRYGTSTTGTMIPETELRSTLDKWRKEAEMERQQQEQERRSPP